ncbi:hypothetical protein [Flavobacterium orientale]|uniref:Uncharacterized protein n=1 Tax=Flavobacterium orientale TaxID=1756020 RepID=A0A917DE26_9FLAO|nr:hypothetical protein [Flavobacterium orientale]GGD30541.1 hypothetical protein GCM10011343_20920 [Flavobacterium orientale]
MKNILLTLLISILISSCGKNRNEKVVAINGTQSSNESSEFKIIKDTFDFSINGDLRKVTYFNDKYYCMFETNRENTSKSFKKMVVLDKNGTFVEDVFVTGGIQNMIYYNIRIENDSLFLQRAQFDEENFVLGKYVADFQPTETRAFKTYEDEQFNVYATCRGEWGGTVFFQDKKTNELFEGSSTCPIVVNKIGSEYFVTNYMGHMIGFASVNKISDPRKLEKSKWDFKQRFGSENQKGIEKVLDTMGFYIPTSFVSKRKLVHIYNDDDGTYIAEIENGKMKPIYTFDFKFYPQFNQQLENGKQVLTFEVAESEKDGVLLIDGNKLNFKFLR